MPKEKLPQTIEECGDGLERAHMIILFPTTYWSMERPQAFLIPILGMTTAFSMWPPITPASPARNCRKAAGIWITLRSASRRTTLADREKPCQTALVYSHPGENRLY